MMSTYSGFSAWLGSLACWLCFIFQWSWSVVGQTHKFSLYFMLSSLGMLLLFDEFLIFFFYVLGTISLPCWLLIFLCMYWFWENSFCQLHMILGNSLWTAGPTWGFMFWRIHLSCLILIDRWILLICMCFVCSYMLIRKLCQDCELKFAFHELITGVKLTIDTFYYFFHLKAFHLFMECLLVLYMCITKGLNCTKARDGFAFFMFVHLCPLYWMFNIEFSLAREIVQLLALKFNCF